MSRAATDSRLSGSTGLSVVPADIAERLLFVGGLHRSGTSLLHRLLADHPEISAFAETGAPEDEGQHLQSVFPPAKAHGGPGRFGFAPASYLTERSPLVSTANAERLLSDWMPYWDLSRPVLVEKSPPNIVRARFLQALFPRAAFVFLVRHPACAALATQKWSKTSVVELILHWLLVHGRLLSDLAHIRCYALLRYEDVVADPGEATARLFDFVGLPPHEVGRPVEDRNRPYLRRWRTDHRGDAALLAESGLAGLLQDFGYRLEPPFVLSDWAARSPAHGDAGSPRSAR
jgi:hypothetical protein